MNCKYIQKLKPTYTKYKQVKSYHFNHAIKENSRKTNFNGILGIIVIHFIVGAEKNYNPLQIFVYRQKSAGQKA